MVDGIQCLGAQVVLLHGDEPLRRGAEDDRFLAAPAVRVAVRDLGLLQQHAEFRHFVADRAVGGVDIHAREKFDILPIPAIVIDRIVHIQPVPQAHLIVVRSVTRSGMDAAGTGIQSDMLAQDDQGRSFVQRVPAVFPLQQPRGKCGQHLRRLPAQLRRDRILEPFGNDEHLVFHPDRHVRQIGIEANRQIGRNGPGRGGPDDKRKLFALQDLQLLGQGIVVGKLHKDGRRRMIGVLHFGLCQRGHAGAAPVHRLLSLVEAATFGKARQLARDSRFIMGIQGKIGTIPLAQNAQTLKFGALDPQPFPGIGTAGLANVNGGTVLLFGPQFLVHHQFDGQSMTVPAWHVGREVPFHPLAFNDDILQDLVEGMADMDVAVGVGRAVVQHEGRLAGTRGGHFPVKIHFLPVLEHFLLPLREIGAHGKIGDGKIQSIFIIHRVLYLQPLKDGMNIRPFQ